MKHSQLFAGGKFGDGYGDRFDKLVAKFNFSVRSLASRNAFANGLYFIFNDVT